MARRLPILIQRSRGASHYVRAHHAFSGLPEIPDDVVMSLCGFVRIYPDGTFGGGRQAEPATQTPTVKLPTCARCLDVAKKYPGRVRVREEVSAA